MSKLQIASSALSAGQYFNRLPGEGMEGESLQKGCQKSKLQIATPPNQQDNLNESPSCNITVTFQENEAVFVLCMFSVAYACAEIPQ